MGSSDLNFIIQIVLFTIILIILILLIRFDIALRKEKRISPYSLKPLKNDSKSIYDIIGIFVKTFNKRISKILEKSVFITKYSKRYEKYIDYSTDYETKGMDLISNKVLAGLLGIIILIIFDVFRSRMIRIDDIFVIFVFGFFTPNIYYVYKNRNRKKQVEDDLLKAVIIINNAFKSGRTIVQAVGIVKDELDGPIRDEFSKIYIDLSYGLGVDIVFSRFAARVNSPQASYIASSLTILNRTGGNIVKVFNSIEKYFFNRQKLKNELKSLTAAARAIFKILLVIPVLLCVLIFIINPEYFYPLFTSTPGLIIIGMDIIIYVVYIVVIRKVMNIRM